MPRKMLKPPIKLRKKYEPLIELCRNTVLTSPSQTSGTEGGSPVHLTVVIAWPVREGTNKRLVPDYPKGFPAGIVVSIDEGVATVKHSCVTLLSFFKSAGYTSYDASDLFAQRLPILMKLAKLELKLDRMLESVDVEQQHTKDIDSDE